jgi:hypothetical protein
MRKLANLVAAILFTISVLFVAPAFAAEQQNTSGSYVALNESQGNGQNQQRERSAGGGCAWFESQNLPSTFGGAGVP